MSFMPTALLAKDQMLNAHMPILLQRCASEMIVLACHLQRFYVWEILFSAHACAKPHSAYGLSPVQSLMHVCPTRMRFYFCTFVCISLPWHCLERVWGCPGGQTQPQILMQRSACPEGWACCRSHDGGQTCSGGPCTCASQTSL